MAGHGSISMGGMWMWITTGGVRNSRDSDRHGQSISQKAASGRKPHSLTMWAKIIAAMTSNRGDLKPRESFRARCGSCSALRYSSPLQTTEQLALRNLRALRPLLWAAHPTDRFSKLWRCATGARGMHQRLIPPAPCWHCPGLTVGGEGRRPVEPLPSRSRGSCSAPVPRVARPHDRQISFRSRRPTIRSILLHY
ncbi:hypothetical protein BP5796_10479 [Coleophoma crateriformis]|uniref:Uncharacterized protein n=1 Tax=Coleophoma crateriformis TaxID=565419 RepID=A0A3D8QQC5_9HELO|nr:hypothetical protein BP5796_10479 [Coleophoma crateriformis]